MGYQCSKASKTDIRVSKRYRTKTYKKAVSAGKGFVKSVSNGYQSVKKTYTSFESYVAERTSEIRAEIKRELCTTVNRISDKLEKVDWKKVGIAVLATAATVGVGVLTGGAGLAAAGALGLKGTLGGAIVAGAVTGAIGGATYGGTSSNLSGNDLKQVAKDTLVGGATGSLTGGAMGGLAYGADKAVGALKNLMTGGSKPKPGHITEMATKKLNSDDVEIPLLEDKRAGQLLLEDKQQVLSSNKILR